MENRENGKLFTFVNGKGKSVIGTSSMDAALNRKKGTVVVLENRKLDLPDRVTLSMIMSEQSVWMSDLMEIKSNYPNDDT